METLMNVFFVDQDPIVAAQCLVDQHVNKMVTETAQILSNCYTLEELANPDCPRTQTGKVRKHSYPHHPCCKWATDAYENWEWVVKHGLALEKERLFRGFKPSYSVKFIQWSLENPPLQGWNRGKVSPPAQAFGEEFKFLSQPDPVEAYRSYYRIAKRKQTTLKKVWTRRGAPYWW